MCLRATRDWETMSYPATVTLPLLGGMYPVIIFIVVVFPAPLGPRNPKTSPGSTRKEMPVIAGKSPKFLVTFSSSIMPQSANRD